MIRAHTPRIGQAVARHGRQPYRERAEFEHDDSLPRGLRRRRAGSVAGVVIGSYAPRRGQQCFDSGGHPERGGSAAYFGATANVHGDDL